MAVSLKLSQKGAILVAVPLFFELLFVFILVMLLQQADAEAQQQARSRAIIYQADDLSRIFHEANLTLLGYSSTRSPLFYDRFEELTGKIPAEIKELKELLGGSEESRSELLADTQKGLDALCNARKFLVENSGNLADFSARHMFSAIASSTNELETKLKAFIHEQESKQHEHEVAQMLARTRLKWLIAVGVLFNILISLALTVFFVRGIGRRVDVLRDNAYRLAAGQKLNAPAFGDDEISELDGVFHQMARSLREAAQRESAIFENAMDVICSIDQNGRFATVSPASLKLLGFDPEDLIGTRFFELIVPEDVEAAREAVQRIMEGTTIEQCQAIFETRMTGKDGGERDVLWSACWSQEQQTVFAV
ncbi:MAG TPA: PAS domain S-box protein, partial [Candidatus Obscuribacter sp.]|nr:PAS domain S-box protein [Candidatus Obscuribacter sp.]